MDDPSLVQNLRELANKLQRSSRASCCCLGSWPPCMLGECPPPLLNPQSHQSAAWPALALLQSQNDTNDTNDDKANRRPSQCHWQALLQKEPCCTARIETNDTPSRAAFLSPVLAGDLEAQPMSQVELRTWKALRNDSSSIQEHRYSLWQ